MSVKDSDLFLVERSGKSYKATFAELQAPGFSRILTATVTNNFTFPPQARGISADEVQIQNGVTVTIDQGASWSIV